MLCSHQTPKKEPHLPIIRLLSKPMAGHAPDTACQGYLILNDPERESKHSLSFKDERLPGKAVPKPSL